MDESINSSSSIVLVYFLMRSFYLNKIFSADEFRLAKYQNVDNKLSFRELSDRILIELNNSIEFKNFIRNKFTNNGARKFWKNIFYS